MNDAEYGANVDAAMKNLPAFPTETANPACGRGNRHRNQKNESREADSDEGPFGDVFQHSRDVERLIGTQVRQEVKADIEKDEKAQHTAEPDEFGQMQKFAERRNAKRENEKAKCPIAGLMLQKLNRICREVAAETAPRE